MSQWGEVEGEGEGVNFVSMMEVLHGLMVLWEIPKGVEVEGIDKNMNAVGVVVGLDNHKVSLNAQCYNVVTLKMVLWYRLVDQLLNAVCGSQQIIEKKIGFLLLRVSSLKSLRCATLW